MPSLNVTFQSLMGAIEEHVDQLDIQSDLPSQETSIYGHGIPGFYGKAHMPATRIHNSLVSRPSKGHY